MSARRALLLAALGALCAGCSHPKTLQLSDTEGRSFSAHCSTDTGCRLDKKGVALRVTGRVVGICDAPSGHSPTASDCRPLTCKTDTDCPPRHNLPHGTCLDGLCIEPAHSINVDDAVMLCLAGTGLGRSSAEQVQRYALAQNCGSPCRVPAPCRQP